MRCSMLGQMIWIWGWESSLSADLHCESWITRLWGWGSSELLGVWYGRDTGELQERKMQCMQVEVSNSVSAGAAKETLPGTNRVNADHITQAVLSKIILWKVRRRDRVEVSVSPLSRTVEALESWRRAIGKMGTWGEIGSL